MQMRRLAIATAVTALALAGFGVGAGVASIVPYTGAGDWFAPGQGRSSNYDWCHYWTGNNFAKGSSAWGLVTFITPSGGWRYSVQKYGTIFRTLSDYRWTKKLHCKNNSNAGYQGGCWGDRQDGGTCV
jgi:hypothetical protein